MARHCYLVTLSLLASSSCVTFKVSRALLFRFQPGPLREFAGFYAAPPAHRFVFQIAPFCPHSQNQPSVLSSAKLAGYIGHPQSDGFSYQPFALFGARQSAGFPFWRGSRRKATRLWLAPVLRPQFLHIRKSRPLIECHIGPSQDGGFFSRKQSQSNRPSANGKSARLQPIPRTPLELVRSLRCPILHVI